MKNVDFITNQNGIARIDTVGEVSVWGEDVSFFHYDIFQLADEALQTGESVIIIGTPGVGTSTFRTVFAPEGSQSK